MKVFFNANVILDKFDETRPYYKYSVKVYKYCLLNEFEIYTSCDIITTIYYINSKKNKNQALLNIQNLIKTLKIIEFSNEEINEACKLMLKDNNYFDLEDTLQYILARKQNCDFIISNDKNFISKEILLLTSEEFFIKYAINKKKKEFLIFFTMTVIEIYLNKNYGLFNN